MTSKDEKKPYQKPVLQKIVLDARDRGDCNLRGCGARFGADPAEPDGVDRRGVGALYGRVIGKT
jgi:hypothetical protein